MEHSGRGTLAHTTAQHVQVRQTLPLDVPAQLQPPVLVEDAREARVAGCVRDGGGCVEALRPVALCVAQGVDEQREVHPQ